jgi:hypothetical protein
MDTLIIVILINTIVNLLLSVSTIFVIVGVSRELKEFKQVVIQWKESTAQLANLVHTLHKIWSKD